MELVASWKCAINHKSLKVTVLEKVFLSECIPLVAPVAKTVRRLS